MGSNAVFSNMLWRFFERVGARGISIVVSVVLARLLDPDTYGMVALISAILVIIDTFVDGGLGTALIQKKDSDAIDYSSVFYFNICSSVVLYFLTFIIAPFVAEWYKDLSLIPLIRVAAITLLISGVKNVQQAYVSHHMMFKTFFYSTLGGTIVAAVVGIFLAYRGFGVWALVVQSVVNPFIDTLILWFTVRWRPICAFSFGRMKGLFGFGGRYLVALLIGRVTDPLNQFFIGKVYTKADLAYYNQGYKLPSVVTENVNSAMESVLFAELSKNQEDNDRIRQITKRALQVSCYMIMPLMMGLAACGQSLVHICLTDKWMPCLPFLYLFCFVFALYPISVSNIDVWKSLGKKEFFIKNQVSKSAVSVLLLLFTMRYGTFAIAIGTVVSAVFGVFINAWPNKKLIDYSLARQFKDILPTIVLTIVMGAIVFCMDFLPITELVTLILQVLVGGAIYIGISAMLKYPSYQYLKTIVLGYIYRIGGIRR